MYPLFVGGKYKVPKKRTTVWLSRDLMDRLDDMTKTIAANVEVSLLKEPLSFMMGTIGQRWYISICLLLFQVQLKDLLNQVEIVFQDCFINIL